MTSSAIEARGLSKTFGEVAAVSDLDLDVASGEIFGFLGPNGAGKTTTIRMLVGLLRPTRGTAKVAGHDVVDDAIEAKRRLGFLAENPYAYEKLTGREFLDFVADLYRIEQADARERSAHLLSLFDLDEAKDRTIEGYSRGMRQKLGLVAALQHEPQVLFLDEPTSGLDPRSARAVKDLLVELARRGRTVFLSTHVLEIAEHMCHRVGIINGGRLVGIGSLDELRSSRGRGASLEDIFLELTGGAEVAELKAFLED